MEPKPEFYDWLQRNDPEGPQVIEEADRKTRIKLQDALTAAMDLEFEQLKANEQWAMRQADLWRKQAMEHERKLTALGRYPLLRGAFYGILAELLAVGLLWAIWRLL